MKQALNLKILNTNNNPLSYLNGVIQAVINTADNIIIGVNVNGCIYQ
jgi:hypothetical protein